jgi:hypothetical protein
VLAASVPTPNLSSVSCLAVRYRLLPATFPRCQNCARNVAGVTFTNPDDDEVDDEFEIPEIGTGMNDSNNPSNTLEDEANADDDDFGEEDDIVDEGEDATTKSSATRTRGRQAGKRVSGSKRVALSLQQKVDIINFFDSSKDSTSKPISLTQLGIWAQKRFHTVLPKPPSNGMLSLILTKQRNDILLRHNQVLSDKGKQRKRQRKNVAGNQVCLPINYLL